MKRIGVLGAGTWGMALARMLCISGHEVTVWSAIDREIDEFSVTRRHPNLPGMVIPEKIRFTKDMETACTGMDVCCLLFPLLLSVPLPGRQHPSSPTVRSSWMWQRASKLTPC